MADLKKPAASVCKDSLRTDRKKPAKPTRWWAVVNRDDPDPYWRIVGTRDRARVCAEEWASDTGMRFVVRRVEIREA